MLNEHTLDQLRGLRLDGMVHALERPGHQHRRGRTGLRGTPGDAGAARDRLARRQAPGAAAQGRQAQGQQRLHRGHRLARLARRWTAASSPRWPAATGCATRQQRPDHRRDRRAARPGWRARWRSRPRARASRCCTCARRGCSRSCASPTATAASRRRLAQLARIDLLLIDDFAIAPIAAGRAQRPARTARRPRGHARHADHQPAAGERLARVAGRSDARRRDPRPHRARRHKIDLKGESMRKKQEQCNDRFAQSVSATAIGREHGLPTAAVVRRKRRPPPWTSLRPSSQPDRLRRRVDHPGDARRRGQRSALQRDRGRLRYDEPLHSRAPVIVHDHAETPSAITLKPASTIAEMRSRAPCDSGSAPSHGDVMTSSDGARHGPRLRINGPFKAPSRRQRHLQQRPDRHHPRDTRPHRHVVKW